MDQDVHVNGFCIPPDPSTDTFLLMYKQSWESNIQFKVDFSLFKREIWDK